MLVELKVPEVGESITEVEIAEWLKSEGARVEKDESVAVIETDKATIELPAPVSGTMANIYKQPGEKAAVGEIIGQIEDRESVEETAKGKPAKANQDGAALATMKAEGTEKIGKPAGKETIEDKPREQRMAEGKKHIKDEDQKLESDGETPEKEQEDHREATDAPREIPLSVPSMSQERAEEVVPMSPLRRRVAERLVEAQHTAALLTTFNEIDMSTVISLRRQYAESFQKKYGVKLGFMSFFVKASIEALKLIPQVNAEIRGTDIVYRYCYDIGVAVGGGRGLVVPVLRHADRMSFAEIEVAIADFARRARESKLTLQELQGGTFTISNGGIYGSLLSTPIVNPPQSGILGLQAIQDRPVARAGDIVIRAMMYVAFTYDHRIIDGREAVTFLKHIKEIIEDPARMLLEI